MKARRTYTTLRRKQMLKHTYTSLYKQQIQRKTFIIKIENKSSKRDTAEILGNGETI
jgi:hypothetical protein